MNVLTDFKVIKKCRPLSRIDLIHTSKGAQVWAIGGVLSKASHIQIIDCDSFTTIKEIAIDKKKCKITALQQMPNDRVWIGFSDGSFRLYNCENFEYLHWKDAFKSTIISIGFVPSEEDDSFTAWASDYNGMISVWNVKGIDSISPLVNSEAHIGSVVPVFTCCAIFPKELEAEDELTSPSVDSDSEPELDEPPDMFSDWKELFTEDGEEKKEEEDDEKEIGSSIMKNILKSSLSEGSYVPEDIEIIPEDPSIDDITSSKEERQKKSKNYMFSGDKDGRIVMWEPSVSIKFKIYSLYFYLILFFRMNQNQYLKFHQQNLIHQQL